MKFLTNPSRRHKKIKLYYWINRKQPEKKNFGDELSWEIVQKLSGRKVQWADKDECELVALGSILQSILSRKGSNHVKVWGTGLMFGDQDFNYDRSLTEFKMVRGKLTSGELGLSNVTYGDPGLLADLLYKPSKKKKKIGIVPHYVDANSPVVAELSGSPDVKVINVFDGPEVVVPEIASCELVVSSSLHGMISAHAFGVPAYWVELSDAVAGDGFKFRDYYSVFGQEPQKIGAKNLKNVVADTNSLIDEYRAPKDLGKIKDAMINSFPQDSR